MNVQKLRDEWRSLNLQINQCQKVIKQNSITNPEYLQWVNELISYRDSITNLI